MNVTITSDHVYMFVIFLLMGIQIYQNIQLSKTKGEVDKLWDQISLWNTMVAMKLLDTQKEIDKLNNKENKDGEQTKKDS